MTDALAKDEFTDFETPLYFFDFVNNIDSLLYMLMAVSFMKTLVFWRPETFRIVTDMLGKFFSRVTLYTIIVSQTMGTLGTFLLSNSLAPYIYGFNDLRKNTIRASVLGS